MENRAASSPNALYGQSAISSSIWMLGLMAVAKLMALASSLLLGIYLTPEEFGLAGFAISASMYVMVFNIWCFADVLCAAPRRFSSLGGQVQTLAIWTSLLQALLIVALGALLSLLYPNRSGLFAMLLMVALRPVGDALCAVPMYRLRVEFRYRANTGIELVSALFGSGLSVAMGRAGAGASALVLPSIASLFLRAALVWHDTVSMLRQRRRVRSWRPIMRAFMVLSIGSYVSGILTFVETSILGIVAPDRSVGLFVFAFGLAVQLNGIIGLQLAAIIQPIMGYIRGDPARQSAGLVRANRLLAAMLVPALLIQAASTSFLFEIAWPGKWGDAALIHQVLSIGQVFAIFAGSSQFMLKGQGRYRTFTILNLANLMTLLAVLPLAALFGAAPAGALVGVLGLHCPGPAEAAVAVAVVGGLVRLAFGLVSVRVAAGHAHVGWGQVIGLYGLPLAVATPVAVGTWWIMSVAIPACPGRLAQAAVLVVACTAAWVVGAGLCLLPHPSSRRDGAEIAQQLMRKLRLAPAAS
jgi:O-antigen/teichoic acid export membrane protein